MKPVFTIDFWPNEFLLSDFCEKVAQAMDACQQIHLLQQDFAEYAALGKMLEVFNGESPDAKLLHELGDVLTEAKQCMLNVANMHRVSQELGKALKRAVTLISLPVALKLTYGMEDRTPKRTAPDDEPGRLVPPGPEGLKPAF